MVILCAHEVEGPSSSPAPILPDVKLVQELALGNLNRWTRITIDPQDTC